jgi:hypothetical protein
MSNQIIPGSLSSLSKTSGRSLAESFLSCDTVIIVDTSGSMGTQDSRGNRSRYDVACEELSKLQQTLPGKIAVLSFSDDVEFCPSGIPKNLNASTNMTKALQFAKIADIPGMHFILISDGCPDNKETTLQVARTYKNHIDTIFVGPESDMYGRDFLTLLSNSTGGQSITVDRAKELSAGIQKLLLA